MTKRKGFNLYWVTTKDHSEGWFVFARKSRSTARFLEDQEGYNTNAASAEGSS
jgi:hypothetical protein